MIKYDPGETAQIPTDVNIVSSTDIDVNIQDQTTPSISLYFGQGKVDTTVLNSTTIDTYSIDLTTVAGVAVGDYMYIINIANVKVWFGHIIALPGGTTVTVDTPFNFAYQAGDLIRVQTSEMAVNGSVTRQDYAISGPGGAQEIDITRLLFTMQLSGAPDDGLFGNIARITNGVVIRLRDGDYINLANFKDNSDLANLCYDLTYAARSGGGGTWGLRARWTFGGQNKMGVVLRLKAGEFLEALISDDLSGITSFKIIAQGHYVDP